MNGENQKLILSWNLSSFEPHLKDWGLEECSEVLNPEDFLDQHYAKEYCCYPERLMYMKWIHERVRFGAEGLPQDTERYYLERFSGLNLVTEQIRNWVSEWKKGIDELGSVGEHHKDFVDYWDKYMAHIQYWRCVFEENQLDDNQRVLFTKAAEEIKHVIDSESVPKDNSTEGQLRAILLEMISSENKILVNIDTVKPFANSADEYLRQIQKRLSNDLSLGKSMDMLMENIGSYVHRQDKLNQTTVAVSTHLYELTFSKRYENDSRHLLQKGVQHLCNLCSGIDELTSQFNEEINKILPTMPDKKKQKWKKDELGKYLYDPVEGIKRCIALIIYENKQYVAFSGFLDCTDPELIKWLHTGVGLCEYFGQVSEKCYDATLVYIDKRVAEKMRRFIWGTDFKPKKLETLYERAKKKIGFHYELLPESLIENLNQLRKEIKDAYACCERKLIAYLENANRTKPIEAKLFVAKEPCVSCSLALQDWLENNPNITFVIDYPEQHKIN